LGPAGAGVAAGFATVGACSTRAAVPTTAAVAAGSPDEGAGADEATLPAGGGATGAVGPLAVTEGAARPPKERSITIHRDSPAMPTAAVMPATKKNTPSLRAGATEANAISWDVAPVVATMRAVVDTAPAPP
jgi:hypothetical protein